jgi:pSer/pThr/pTyr-binding forkhead associated (FHA) protein
MNNKNNVRLGRGHDADIRISDISVSRFHALIRYENNQFFLEDNASKFGTLIEVTDGIRFDTPGQEVTL